MHNEAKLLRSSQALCPARLLPLRWASSEGQRFRLLSQASQVPDLDQREDLISQVMASYSLASIVSPLQQAQEHSCARSPLNCWPAAEVDGQEGGRLTPVSGWRACCADHRTASGLPLEDAQHTRWCCGRRCEPLLGAHRCSQKALFVRNDPTELACRHGLQPREFAMLADLSCNVYCMRTIFSENSSVCSGILSQDRTCCVLPA